MPRRTPNRYLLSIKLYNHLSSYALTHYAPARYAHCRIPVPPFGFEGGAGQPHKVCEGFNNDIHIVDMTTFEKDI